MIRGALVVAAALLVTVCALAGEERLPERLSETGLYEAGRPGVVASVNRPFSPQYPLWTDGAQKRRWVYLPPGATIDASDPGAWEMPVGTRFWKEFAFDGRKVETRMIWRASSTRWMFASYRWNEDGTEAFLVPEEGARGVAEIAPGRRHSIPSASDCTTCHGTARVTPLGFNALQLSPDRDPAAIHGEPLSPGMLTLDTLAQEGRLAHAPTFDEPPRIRTSHASTRAALGYLVANCGSCHNGRGEIAALAPVLKYDELLSDADAVAERFVGQATRWQVPSVPAGESALIDPHALDRSALLVRMRSRRPSSQMPPLGTVLADAEALERLTAWAAEVAERSGRRSRR